MADSEKSRQICLRRQCRQQHKKVSPKVLEAMLPYFKDKYGNPSSLYSLSREAAEAVDARAKIAELLGARPNEIYFTASGSEADNLGGQGAARANMAKGRHIVTSKIEHYAVLHTCKAPEVEGRGHLPLTSTATGLSTPRSFARRCAAIPYSLP